MATLGKRKVPLTKKDLDQAILKANNKLKKDKVFLTNEVKELKNQSKELNKAIKESNDNLDNLGRNIELLSDNESSINSDIAKLQKKKNSLSTSVELLSIQEKEIIDNIDSIDKKISAKEKTIDKYSDSIAELKGLKMLLSKDYKALSNDIDTLNKSYSKIEEDLNLKRLEFDRQLKNQQVKLSDCDNVLSTSLKSIKRLSTEEEGLKSSIKEIEKTIENKSMQASKKIEEKKDSAYKELAITAEQLNKLNNAILKSKQELIDIEGKRKAEEESIKEMKEKAKKFKIDFTAEIARLKIKNKVDVIDKAGLKEVFNG